MKCTKKLEDTLFRKKKEEEESNSETKLIRILFKGDAQKISCPAEIYELQPLPVCVLCCLMAALVSD